MGSSVSTHTNNNYEQHPRLGPITVTQYFNHHLNQNVQTMDLTKSLHSQTLFNEWKSFIIKINDSEIRQLILLPQKYSFLKHGLCTNSGTFNATYQYFPYTLTNEILDRTGIQKYFQEKQIWYLLYNLIRAANKFERINRKIGNIHPDNILINSIGQIKILAACSLPGERNNFELMAQNENSNVYLAPEQLANDAIKGSHYPSNVNCCLSEVFSIGMTVLTGGSLLQCQNLYQKHKNSIRFNSSGLLDILSVFREVYSQYLGGTLESMLQVNPCNRKSAGQIYQQLYQYERQILNLESFVPKYNNFKETNISDINSGKNRNVDKNFHQQQCHQRNKIFSTLPHTVKVVKFTDRNDSNHKINNFSKQKDYNGRINNKPIQQSVKNNIHQNQQAKQNNTHPTIEQSKHSQKLNHNLSPQMTGTFSYHHINPPIITEKYVNNHVLPSSTQSNTINVNTQRIVTSPIMRLQSPPQFTIKPNQPQITIQQRSQNSTPQFSIQKQQPQIRIQQKTPPPQFTIQQRARSPLSIIPGPISSSNNIRSRVSTSPISNSKVVFQQTKILPMIRPSNASESMKDTLPVVSIVVKNQQNPDNLLAKNQQNQIVIKNSQNLVIKNQKVKNQQQISQNDPNASSNNPQNSSGQTLTALIKAKNVEQQVSQNVVSSEQKQSTIQTITNQLPVNSKQNISTIKTIPLNSVIHSANLQQNKSTTTSKPLIQGTFLPLDSVPNLDNYNIKSLERNQTKAQVYESQGETEKSGKQQQNENTQHQSQQHQDQDEDQQTQFNQKQIEKEDSNQIQNQNKNKNGKQETQKQITIDSKLVSFQKVQ